MSIRGSQSRFKLYYLLYKVHTKYKDELARLVMGTIFLVMLLFCPVYVIVFVSGEPKSEDLARDAGSGTIFSCGILELSLSTIHSNSGSKKTVSTLSAASSHS